MHYTPRSQGLRFNSGSFGAGRVFRLLADAESGGWSQREVIQSQLLIFCALAHQALLTLSASSMAAIAESLELTEGNQHVT